MCSLSSISTGEGAQTPEVCEGGIATDFVLLANRLVLGAVNLRDLHLKFKMLNKSSENQALHCKGIQGASVAWE